MGLSDLLGRAINRIEEKNDELADYQYDVEYMGDREIEMKFRRETSPFKKQILMNEYKNRLANMSGSELRDAYDRNKRKGNNDLILRAIVMENRNR